MGLRNTEYSINKGIDVKQGFFLLLLNMSTLGMVEALIMVMRWGWKVDGDWIEKSLPDQMKNFALFRQQGRHKMF